MLLNMLCNYLDAAMYSDHQQIYPSPIRATGHGMSAAAGKLGALVPEIIFNYGTMPHEIVQVNA